MSTLDNKINKLLKEIGQDYPECGFYIGEGWFPAVSDALKRIAEVGVPWKLAQVKQKFCQLRIYVDYPDPKENGFWEEDLPQYEKYKEIEDIIRFAEIQCNEICEKCGGKAPGGARGGWKGCRKCKFIYKINAFLTSLHWRFKLRYRRIKNIFRKGKD